MSKVRIVVKSFSDPEYRHVVTGTEKGVDERRAEKVTRGLLINMNRDEYYVGEEEVDEPGT